MTTHPTRTILLPACIAAILLLPAIALAHAFLDHSDPKVGSVVHKPPADVRIWFTEAVEPDFSTIEVRDADKKQVDKKDTHADKDDAKLLIVSLKTLSPGTYTVHWHVVSVDTHTTEGTFKFTYQPSDQSTGGH
jgi:copper resistance protein C